MRALWEEFEALETHEARFAKAMDRFQPLLHNYYTRGGTWKEPGVTQDRVLARKELIGLASPELWTYAESLIQDATRQGFLRPPRSEA